MRVRSLLLATLLFAVALVPRVFYLIEAKQNPLFTDFYLDAKSYDTWAQEIAGGAWAGDRAFHMAPLYPYLLGAYYAVSDRNLLLLRVIQHCVGAASLVLLFAVARRLFGSRVAVVAFLLGVGYGPFLYFEGQVLASFLGVFLGLLSLHLLLRSLDRGGKGLFLAGLVLGIGAVGRPNLLFFLPFVILWILLREGGARRGAFAYGLGFALALVPSTAYNVAVSGEWIPISSHGGISFYLGNNEYTTGTYVPPPQFGGTPEAIDIYDSKRLAESETGRSMTASEISSFWYRKSFDWIRGHPGRFAALLGRKIALYFNDFEIPLDYNYEFDRRLYPVLRLAPVPFGVLLALAFVGMVRLPRDRPRGWLLVLFVVANAASVIAFFICARYRQTAVPAVAVLAALALVRMAEDALARRWKRFAAAAAGAVLIAVPFHVDVYRGEATSEARSACILGKAYAAAGDPVKAEEAYRVALAAFPDHVDSHMNLGMLDYQEGRAQGAVHEFSRATELAPGFAGAWNNLGNALREAGMPERAVTAIRRAVEIDPSYGGAWNNLGFTLAAGGREDEAADAYRRAIEIDPASVHAWANLTDLLLGRGDLAAALETIDRGARANPGVGAFQWKRGRTEDAVRAYDAAALALRRGDREEAGRALATALQAGGEPVRRWAARDPALAAFRADPVGGETR